MIDWDEQPLGRVQDTDLARELGVSTQSVYQARKRRGIPPFAPPGHGRGNQRRAETAAFRREVKGLDAADWVETWEPEVAFSVGGFE